MELETLTSEERSALTALARSPGWALLVEKLFLPQIQRITRFLDRAAIEQSGRADWLRGVKVAYMNEVEIVYTVAGIPNPFVQHALGLLVDLGHSTAEEAGAHKHKADEEEQKISDRVFRGGRSHFPV